MNLVELISRQEELNLMMAGESWKQKDWRFAAIAESIELADWVGWKWWAKQEKNQIQIIVELVDILFFLLSMLSAENKKETYIRGDLPFSLDPIEEIKKLNNYLLNQGPSIIFSQYLSLIQSLGLTFDTIKRYYYGKYELNMLRFDNGYKQGKYEKYWNGKEDNLVMMTLIKENPGMACNQIGITLRNLYRESQDG